MNREIRKIYRRIVGVFRGHSSPPGLSEEIKEQLAESIQAFKNRTIHRTLTELTINTTSDDDLIQIVFDNLSEKFGGNYEKEFETVASWNRSRQAIYLIWLLEAEVNNGGFNQFYFNSSGKFYPLLPSALRLVGATKFADLTEKANNTYEKEYENITSHYDGTLEGFSKSYEDNPLNEYDKTFYALCQVENLPQLQVDYIRENISDFADK